MLLCRCVVGGVALDNEWSSYRISWHCPVSRFARTTECQVWAEALAHLQLLKVLVRAADTLQVG